jgi:hypothetical protein
VTASRHADSGRPAAEQITFDAKSVAFSRAASNSHGSGISDDQFSRPTGERVTGGGVAVAFSRPTGERDDRHEC